MRLLAVLALLALGSVAVACPNGARCASADSPRETGTLKCPIGALCAIAAPAPAAEVAAPKRPVSLRLVAALDLDRWKLRVAPPKPSDDLAMPWIWQVLRSEVYDRMPTYQRDAFTFVLSPVIISGSFDTVPGFGLSGDF